MFENSSINASNFEDKFSTLEDRLLKAITAGIAASKPTAVAISAPAIPGATFASVACCMLVKDKKACIIPQTVPNNPM